MKKGLFFIVFFATFPTEILSQDADGSSTPAPKYSNEFMQIGVGARAFGMGFTATAFVEDVTAGYWNPAGLTHLTADHQLGLMHASYFGGLANYDYAGFATSVDSESKLGLTLIRFAVDDIPDTRFLVDVNGAINYENIQFFSSADYGFLFSYARKLPLLGGIDAGANVKVIHRTVGSFSKAWGFGLDFGIQKKIAQWQTALMMRDVFGTFNAWSHNVDDLEAVYRLTGNDIPINSLEITLPRLIMGAARAFKLIENFGLLVSSDLDMTFDGKRNTIVKTPWISLDPRIGAEFDYKQMVFLRVGANQFQYIKDFDGSKQLTFQPNMGLGLVFRELHIDYALTDVGNLAPGLFSHVFSLKVDFNVED